jgi:phage-related tail fiber protein
MITLVVVGVLVGGIGLLVFLKAKKTPDVVPFIQALKSGGAANSDSNRTSPVDDPATVAFIEGLKKLEQSKLDRATVIASLASEAEMDQLATVPVNYRTLH